MSQDDRLASSILIKREHLPDKPSPITVSGRYIQLKPLLISRDAEPLFEMSNGNPITLGKRSIGAYDAEKCIWRYMWEGPFTHSALFALSLQAQANALNGLCLCVFDLLSERQIGVVNLMNNYPTHLKIELGGIWYSPIAQGTFANTEATYLMLKHAFNLGYRRVEWKCDAQNQRSRKAALRMGFTFEGIQECHMIVKQRNRDTAWFRILDTEWPDVKEKFEWLLYQQLSNS